MNTESVWGLRNGINWMVTQIGNGNFGQRAVIRWMSRKTGFPGGLIVVGIVSIIAGMIGAVLAISSIWLWIQHDTPKQVPTVVNGGKRH